MVSVGLVSMLLLMVRGGAVGARGRGHLLGYLELIHPHLQIQLLLLLLLHLHVLLLNRKKVVQRDGGSNSGLRR
jgi:hypothetical protein